MMATPHTPPSQKSQVPPPDTALLPPHTSQYDYRTGDLELGREAVLTDLRRYLQVPFVSLAKCVGAVPSQQRLEEMHDHLIRSEVLTNDGLEWKDFIQPAKVSEEMTFKLEGIISGILEQVPNCRVSYLSNMLLSERHNTSLPDGYLVRAKNRTAPRMHWFDIAVPFGFKKERDAKAVRDNEHKMIWSLHNIMREDPCRRFAFGITIEDTQLRLWLGNRGFLAVTEPINCFENIDGVISLFYALGFASASTSLKGLGWDPTVERIYVGGKMQYKFTVGDEVFTTTRELATHSADYMVGRGTRVYEAMDTKGKKVAIKDSWREIDHQSEGEIVEKILASCEKKLEAKDFADAKRHFVGVRLWKDVTIDGASDETVNPVAGDEHDGTWKWKPIDLRPILPERLHSSATGDVPDSSKLSAFLSAQLGIVRRKETRIPQRVHARIVFHDVGVTVKDLVLISLADSLSCLSGGLKGLYYLHKAGWIHRDFSVGNVIWVVGDNGGIGKLGDFEYAKEINSNTSHDDQTGTMHFMAIEVEHQEYLFQTLAPPPTYGDTDVPSSPPFRMNFLHDIESVWWAYAWIFFYHTDTITANSNDSFDVDAQSRQHQLAFPGAIGQPTRRDFFTGITKLRHTCKSILSDRCFKVCDNLALFAYNLQASYLKAEAEHPLIVLDDSLREDMHAKAAEYLDYAQKEAGDIKLCRLFDLRRQKRPREEGETSPTPDNAGKRIRCG
ncbi:hypothetical protein C8R48DRAFT_663814 [Suillus tomentosus]|nr:hypothetical protein C8R48DRAFT_663814 [Suillus tomentosus]